MPWWRTRAYLEGYLEDAGVELPERSKVEQATSGRRRQQPPLADISALGFTVRTVATGR
jgi:hypothetical protein